GAPPIVLVTHHVDEIPPRFTHALLLRAGRILARGPLHDIITAETLSACFGLPLQLEQRRGRFTAWAGWPAPACVPGRGRPPRPASAPAPDPTTRRRSAAPWRGGCRPAARSPRPAAARWRAGDRRPPDARTRRGVRSRASCGPCGAAW